MLNDVEYLCFDFSGTYTLFGRVEVLVIGCMKKPRKFLVCGVFVLLYFLFPLWAGILVFVL